MVGYRNETNLEGFDSGIGKGSYEKLLTIQNGVSNKKHVHTILIQIFSKKEEL